MKFSAFPRQTIRSHFHQSYCYTRLGAFLKNSPIILLDEATASLDVENETLIQAALSRLIKDKTVLVIAHRMRTVSGADKVVVLSNGTVAEQGIFEKSAGD